MRLLALLLAMESGDGSLQFDAIGAAGAGWDEDGNGLFETLVRAIGVEHGGLADVRRIVEHVRAAEDRRTDGGRVRASRWFRRTLGIGLERVFREVGGVNGCAVRTLSESFLASRVSNAMR